jgi:dTMP kinase|tara:strand:- start:14809 stop:15426 length:618 start_codon:yes stop_codon:yes gene_type:complete
VFISFEGIEGSGKSTQIDLLESHLKKLGHKVAKLREPGGTLMGEKIREIFLQDTLEKVDPITEAFLLYASRKHLDQNFLREKINQGYIVIADRYSDATVAYQCFGKGLDKNFIDLMHKGSDLLTPDLTFYLDITAEMSRERISDREMDRMESESIEFFDKVRQGYLKIASENPERVICMDANKSIGELKDEIVTKTKEKLNASLG